MNRSELFATFNKARAAARKGRLDEARLNRALGRLQTKDQAPRYPATISDCPCMDHRVRGDEVGPCLHMIQEMLKHRMENSNPRQMELL